MAKDLIIYMPVFIPLFWAVVLFVSKKEYSRAKFILVLLMLDDFFLFFSQAVFYHGSVNVLHYFEPVYTFTFLSLYPLLYWYIKLLTIETTFLWKNLVFFIPAIFFSLASLIVYLIMNVEEKQAFYNYFHLNRKTDIVFTISMNFQKFIFIFSRIVFIAQAIYIAVNGRKLVKKYNREIANFYSNLETKSISWVNFMLFALISSVIITIAYNIVGRGFFVVYPTLLLIPNLMLGILVFILGYLGYLQNHTIYNLKIEATQNPDEFSPKNVNKQRLNEKLLDLFVNEAVYKNPDLKITHISEKLHTNRTYISKHINTEFSCTFSDFVNRYRIEEAKRLLTEDSSKTYSLNHIAEKSGFGSMGNFMRVFRDFEGITPGQFREKNTV
jgi:AraC-like DNA-binding protein